METTKQSKEDYLKKYLSGYTEDKKKNKKKKKKQLAVIQPRTKIVDDDVDISQLIPSPEAQNDVLFFDEVPQVAEIVDERPLEEIELEKYRTGKKWRMIDDEGENQINETNVRNDSETDQSPPRGKKKRHDSDSDQSPPRGKNTRHDSESDQSPVRINTRHDSDSDQSPPRGKNTRHNNEFDQSPIRKRKITTRHDESDQSPPKRQHDSGSDQSPPKRRKERRHDSGSDQSPPRRRKATRHDSGSDQSPPRKRKATRHDSGSDQSPPRRRKGIAHSGGSELLNTDKRKSDSHKLQKTLTGRAVGLQDASSMRLENEKKRKSDKAALDQLDKELSGKNARTVYRDKSGRKRDLNQEKLKHTEELKKQEEESKQFKEWGKGVAQTQKHKETVEDHIHEMEKPFARYEGDKDLEGMLKDKQRDGDPMSAFLKTKAAKINVKNNVKEKPKYKGRAPPPNRFNIAPGYRWDGVDRSTGFEKKYFERLSDKKAMTEVKYKWNVEDM